jgi:decaprenyl-phosphate phosphoribosyltransferase
VDAERYPVESPVGDGVGDAGATASTGQVVRGLLRTMRPKQWIKNLLVFAAPGAAGVLRQATPFLHALGAFGVFCLAASGTYLLNDAIDFEADRLHHRKRHRPIAAGIVPVGLAKVCAAVLLAAGAGTSLALGGWRLLLVVGCYIGITLSYTLFLKHEPVIDLAAVASGFVLRAIAGGVVTDVAISQWFLIVTSFGSLFVVAGKRGAEHAELGEDRGSHRTTLVSYTPHFLRYVRTTASSVTIAGYCRWAFEKADVASTRIWFELSLVPFVLAVLRYGLILETGGGGAPEDVILSDRRLQLLILIWVLVFGLGVYVA